MAFTTEEREALIELKNKGYSKEEALGFIATTRMGNTSRVEREFTKQEPTPEEPSDAVSDISRGFKGAMTNFDEGMDRIDTAEQRPTAFGRTAGKISAGFRFAGDAVGNVLGGAIRALPGGTTVMNTAEDIIGKGVEKVTQNPTAQKVSAGFNKLPEGVKQPLQDVGNVAMGALGLGEGLVAPGATKALTTGIKEFSQAGIKETGQQGIQRSLKTGLAPEDLMQRVARISKGKQAAFEDRAGQSVGEYLVDRGIFGDPEAITEQLYQRMQTSKGRVDSGLSSVKGVYKNDAVADALEQLAEREARVSTARTPSRDQARVNELLKKHDKEGLTLTEANEVKRLYERNVTLDYLRDNVSDKIAQAKNIDSQMRDFIEQAADVGGFKNVKALNKETSLAKQLLDDLGAEYAGSQGNNYVSLSDAFFLAEAASNPAALAAFGFRKTLGSKSAMSAVAKLIAGKRARTELPSGERTEALQLPAPRPGQLDVSVEQPMQMRAPAEQVGIEERGTATPPPPTEGTQPVIKDALDASEEATEKVRAEMLELSVPGKRIIGEPDATKDSNVIAVPSTFPKWIPSELRSKDLFERVWKYIDEGTAPKKNATQELELYAIVKEQIQRREFDVEAKRNNWDNGKGGIMSIDDVPFSLLFATGAVATYYYADDEPLLPMLAMGGLFRMSPVDKRKLINKQLDSLSKAEKSLIQDGAKYSDSTVRDIIKARKKLLAERDAIKSED